MEYLPSGGASQGIARFGRGSYLELPVNNHQMNIKVVFVEDEAEGICSNCKEVIEDKRYVMMLQVGSITDLTAFDYQLCETCYLETKKGQSGDKT